MFKERTRGKHTVNNTVYGESEWVFQLVRWLRAVVISRTPPLCSSLPPLDSLSFPDLSSVYTDFPRPAFRFDSRSTLHSPRERRNPSRQPPSATFVSLSSDRLPTPHGLWQLTIARLCLPHSANLPRIFNCSPLEAREEKKPPSYFYSSSIVFLSLSFYVYIYASVFLLPFFPRIFLCRLSLSRLQSVTDYPEGRLAL